MILKTLKTLTISLIFLCVTCSVPVNLLETAPTISFEKTELTGYVSEDVPPLTPKLEYAIETDSFSITPLLPEGMLFNSKNGAVSGTPLKSLKRTLFTIKAHNRFGVGEATLNLTIIPLPPSKFSATFDAAAKAVNLKWETPEGVTAVRVFRSTTKDGPFTLVASRSETTWSDSTIGSNEIFYYAVSVFGNNGTSRNSAFISVRTSGENRNPVAFFDTYSTTEDSPVSTTALQGVLLNDSDPDNDQLFATIQDSTISGTLNLKVDGSFTYNPNLNFNGVDSFTYRAKDTQGGTSEPAKVLISITSINDKPTGKDDAYSVLKNGELITDLSTGLLANDFDAEGDLLTAGVVTAAVAGEFILQENGSFAYKPKVDFEGKDSAVYIVKDNVLSDTAVIRFTISATPQQSPQAQNDYFTIIEDAILTGVNILVNDSDPDGDQLSAKLADNQSPLGKVTLTEKGVLTYTPAQNFFGQDSFGYIVDDSHGFKDSAKIYITITSVNDTPKVTTVPPQNTAVGKNFTLKLDNYVSDIEDHDSVIIWTASSPNNLTVSFSQRIATISAKDPLWKGSDTIVFTATDRGNLTASLTVFFTVASAGNSPVVGAIPDQTINEGSSFAKIKLDDFVTDADNAKSEIVWTLSGAKDLTISITSREATISVPNSDWYGSETVTFIATDPDGGSTNASATFTVKNVNDAPVITTASLPNASDRTMYSFKLQSNDNDALDKHTWSKVSGPALLTISETGVISWQPLTSDSAKAHSVKVKVTDNGSPALSTEKTLTITLVPVPKFSVRYDGNNATSGTPPTVEAFYAQGDTVKVLGNTGIFSLAGNTFKGWSTAQSSTNGTEYQGDNIFVMASKAVVLYAQWTTNPTYSVTYEKNDATSGNPPAVSKYEEGAQVTVAGKNSLEKTAYTFVNWNTKEDGSGVTYTVNQKFNMGKVDIKLYPQWKLNTYTVVFDSKGGLTVPSKPVEHGKTVAAPTTEKTGGYSFDGWFTLAGTKFDFTTPIISSFTLEAYWTKYYKVTYDANGGNGSVVDSKEYLSGNKYTVLPKGNLTKTGYSFKHWNTSSLGDGTTRSPDYVGEIGSSDITLFAVWELNKYQVTFDPKGGSALNPITTDHGKTVVGDTLSKLSGYTLGGWYKENSLTNKWNMSTDKVTGPMTLFAKWILNKPVIKTDPSNASIIEGNSVTFSITYDGSLPEFQWLEGTTTITGANSSTLTLSSVDIGKNGKTYRCIVKNSSGSDTSAFATLKVGMNFFDATGNKYDTITIGNQIWMVQNLRTTKFNDGTDILKGFEYETDHLATFDFNYDQNLEVLYGGYYNHTAINSGKLAPTGWRVPTSDDWNNLVNQFGGADNAGSELKDDITWKWPENSDYWPTNGSGFTAHPAGVIMDFNKGFSNSFEISHAFFGLDTRSAGSNEPTALCGQLLEHNNSAAIVNFDNEYYQWGTSGFTVRCVRDKP